MELDTDDEMLTAYVAIQARKKRKMWVREIFLNREECGEFHQYVPRLQNDEAKFHNYYRMSSNCYKMLVQKTTPFFKLGHTNFRKTIGIEERLTVTLRFLAVGEPYCAASHHFRMSENTISKIVTETLQIIYSSLNREYLPQPTKEDWLESARQFLELKNFPNCVGAIDGKHVRIKKPSNCGSLFYNYKQYHSIVLLAVVDANYKFLVIDVGSYGKNSDGGIFEHSNLGKAIQARNLNFPPNSPIRVGGEPMPYVIVGDEAFRLTNYLMRPFPRRSLDREKRIFNYRLSAARQMVECTFGALSSKFRIFDTPIGVNPQIVDEIIKSSCVLHNMIRTVDKCTIRETEPRVPGNNTNAFGSLLEGRNNNQSSREARETREKYKDYFNRIGVTAEEANRIEINDAIINT